MRGGGSSNCIVSYVDGYFRVHEGWGEGGLIVREEDGEVTVKN